jgi:hypothetical protein
MGIGRITEVAAITAAAIDPSVRTSGSTNRALRAQQQRPGRARAVGMTPGGHATR